MKSNLKSNKGITLVALIITIIVLLILAMVSIRLVMNGGIIDKSKSAVDKYSQEEIEEQIKLAHSEYQMHKFTNETQQTETEFLHSKLDQLYGDSNVEITGTDPLMVKVTNNGNTYALKLASNGGTEKVELGPWTQNGTTITNSKTNQTLEVGDTVYYNSGVAEYEGTGENQGKWGALGVEDGKLLIMSTENVATVQLSGKQDYLTDGTTKLNNACIPFKNEANADSARSVKVEDINKITGYTPAAPVTHSYTMVNGYVKMDENEPSSLTTFEDINGKTLPENSPISVTADYYGYGLTDYLTSESKIYNFLNDKSNCYWIDSPVVYSNNSLVAWGFHFMRNAGISNGNLFRVFLFDSYYGYVNISRGVRAVVYLKSDIKLSGNSESGWTIQ